MVPKLEQVFTLRAYIDHGHQLGSTKGGAHRIIVPVTGGFIKGKDLDAEILPGGADWLLFDQPTGTAHLDIRAQARTSEGETIYGHYPGILKFDSEVQKFLEWSPDAKTTKSEDHYFMVTPIWEVSSERLKWMEQTVFVSHGHFVAPGDGRQAVEYEVYKVVSE